VRPLYRNTFSFQPTHKLWLAFNHKPVVVDNSPAIWNRIHLIPFERKFEKHEADKKLLATLKAEAPGILNWAIQGCLAWQSEGLQVPTAVEQATRQYEQESDPIGPFLAECCEQNPEFQVPKSTLWKAYRAWCSEPLSRRAFVEKMTGRGLGERNSRSTRFWTGVRLKAGDTSDASDTNFHNFSSRNSYIEIPKNVSRRVTVSHLES
jgi:putative DNA primase/helicase